MAESEQTSAGTLAAAKVLYAENLATMRWIEQRTLTVTLQVVTLDLVLGAAAVSSGMRLAAAGKVFAGLTLAMLHTVVMLWLVDQRKGHEKRQTHMRTAHDILRRQLVPSEASGGVPAHSRSLTWLLLASVITVGGLTAFVAVLWPGLLAR